MVWAIVAAGTVVAIIVVIILVRRGKSGAAAVRCAGCGRNLVAGWSQCPFCGRVAEVPGAQPAAVGGSWTVQPGAMQPGAGLAAGSGPGNGYMNGNGAMGPYGSQPGYPNAAQNSGMYAPAPGFGAPEGYQAPAMTLPPPSPEQWAAMAPQLAQMAQHLPPAMPMQQPGMPGMPGPGGLMRGPVQGMLEFIRGPLVGRVLTLSQAQDRDGAIRIGSDPKNSIVLPDPSVSRRHAAIRQQGAVFELADLGSTNGIYVNGAKVARHQLQAGDVIRLGGSELVFK